MLVSETFGPFRLRRRIAFGAAAVVFVADPADDHEPGDRAPTAVAIKRLATAATVHPDLTAQLRAEGDLLVRGLAPHPHVVRGHSTGDVAGRPYIEMELVPGADLRLLVELGGERPMPPGAAVRSVLDVCGATSHVHRAGVVHGDINPSNILVRHDGVSKLCDFGVAVTPARRPGGPVRGTAGYMSPEQVRGQEIDRRTDVFALAVVLWELLAGRRLFHRGASWLTLAAVVEAEVPPLPAAVGTPPLDALLARALAKDTSVRFPDSETLAGELERLAGDRGWDLHREAVATLVAPR